MITKNKTVDKMLCTCCRVQKCQVSSNTSSSSSRATCTSQSHATCSSAHLKYSSHLHVSNSLKTSPILPCYCYTLCLLSILFVLNSLSPVANASSASVQQDFIKWPKAIDHIDQQLIQLAQSAHSASSHSHSNSRIRRQADPDSDSDGELESLEAASTPASATSADDTLGDSSSASSTAPKVATNADGEKKNKSSKIDWNEVEKHWDATTTEEEVAKKFLDMENGAKDGVRSLLRSLFPRIVAMSSDAKVSGNCSAGILKWIISLRHLKGWAIRSKCFIFICTPSLLHLARSFLTLFLSSLSLFSSLLLHCACVRAAGHSTATASICFSIVKERERESIVSPLFKSLDLRQSLQCKDRKRRMRTHNKCSLNVGSIHPFHSLHTLCVTYLHPFILGVRSIALIDSPILSLSSLFAVSSLASDELTYPCPLGTESRYHVLSTVFSFSLLSLSLSSVIRSAGLHSAFS